jgi:pantoate kinase
MIRRDAGGPGDQAIAAIPVDQSTALSRQQVSMVDDREVSDDRSAPRGPVEGARLADALIEHPSTRHTT